MSFTLIAAVGKNLELGKDNKLLYRLKQDMSFFKETTSGHTVLMGKNTWLSLGEKPLPKRNNLVVSRSSLSLPPGVSQVKNLDQYISENLDGAEEIFVIGGGKIYQAFLPFASRLLLTEIDATTPVADTFFPNFKRGLFLRNILASGVENQIKFKIIEYKRKENMKDPVFDLISAEETRQKEGLELIPSENYVSPAVLKAAGSVLTNKYSEGYPSFSGIPGDSEENIASAVLENYRYYGGQENIDRIERLAISRACRLFHADHANVQPHSGANANEAVYFAWCEPGDKILAMNLAAGGHLTHGSPVTRSAKIYTFLSYGVTEAGDIDYAALEEIAIKEQPKIILVGYSAFMKIPDFARVRKIADKVPGCLLMADMAHVAGLIAGGVHPNPLDFGFNVMTTTTHKTLRGPRGGLILSKGNVATPLKRPEKTLENIPILIDRSVFPGTQGGPLEHIVAAKAVAFGEALRPDFKDYAKKIVKNAKTLAAELKKRGFVLQGDGTENHLILVNMKKSFNIDGKFYEKALDKIGLNLNANAIPSDKGAAFRPSGVRLGTPALTTRGLEEKDMETIAALMKQVADICVGLGTEQNLKNADPEFAPLREQVRALALAHPVPGIE